jgi:plastocyanin
MNPLSFLKRNKETAQAPVDKRAQEADYEDDSEINIGTKVKIVAAMLVVAVATFVALWVQEPADLKIDVISGTSIADETVKTVETSTPVVTSTSLVAAADTAYPVLAEVSITDFTFTPANMTVKKGTTVVWTNMDPVDHTVTAETFSSSTLEPGDSFTYTFDTAGEYPYGCAFHPQMTGKIIVTADSVSPSAATTTAANADEELPLDYDELFPALSTADDLDEDLELGTGLLSVSTPPAGGKCQC